MASIYLPTPTAEVLVPERTHRLLGLLLLVLVAGLVVGGLVSGSRWLDENLAVAGAAPPTPEAQAVIRPGNGPAVAATVRGRILSLDCTLAGPVEVAEDTTGAWVVTSGAENVRCSHGQFREGFNLRWPPGHQVATEPLS